MAANPYFIRYAQEARTYAIVLFLVTLSSWLFLRYLDNPSLKRSAIYAVVTALAAYAHFFALLVPVAHLASLMGRGRDSFRRRGMIPGAVLYVACVAPLLFFILTRDKGQVNWIADVGLLSLPRLFFAFSGLKDIVAVAVYMLLVPVGLYRLYSGWRAAPGRKAQWPHLFVASWLVLPVAIIMAVSFVKPLFVTRYFIICFPPFILTASLGLASVSGRRAFAACATFTVLISLNAVFTAYQTSKRADWRSATSFVLSSAQPSDAVLVFYGYNWFPFHYCIERLSKEPAPLDIVYPKPNGMDLFALHRSKRIEDAFLRRLAETRKRLWVVVGNEFEEKEFGYVSLLGSHPIPFTMGSHRVENPPAEQILRRTATLYPSRSEHAFHNIRVILLQTSS